MSSSLGPQRVRADVHWPTAAQNRRPRSAWWLCPIGLGLDYTRAIICGDLFLSSSHVNTIKNTSYWWLIVHRAIRFMNIDEWFNAELLGYGVFLGRDVPASVGEAVEAVFLGIWLGCTR